MSRHKPLLFFNATLEWITKIENTEKASIKRSGIFESDVSIELKRNLSTFDFSFDYHDHFYLHGNIALGYYKDDLCIDIGQNEVIVERVFFTHHSPTTISGSFSGMHTSGYSKSEDFYYRIIIPLESELVFHYSLEEQIFESDLGYSSRTGSKFILHEDELTIAVIHDDKKRHYLSIDSLKAQNFESFSEKAFAAKNALAYVTGYYAGNSCYFIAYDNKKMVTPMHLYFSSLRATIKSHYNPINTNPHARLYHDKLQAKKIYDSKILRPLSITEFSALANKIYSNRDFESAIVLIIESSVSSLLFMPGGYAIALETIAPLIFKGTKKDLAPITDKELWEKIRGEILKMVSEHKKINPNHDYNVLETKIINLNAPTNKSKLSAPFEYLGIKLSKDDLKILDTRNDFLHGRAPDITGAGANRSLERLNSDLYYSSLRLYTLLSLLILKWVGYDNYVLNYPKIQQVATGLELDEEPYRKC